MADLDLVVRGRLVLSDRIIADGFVAISEEKIIAVGDASDGVPQARSLDDQRGNWVFPGVVDGQTHLEASRTMDGFGTGSVAAAMGGVTTMVDMPYDEAGLVCTVSRFAGKRSTIERLSMVDVALHASIAPTEAGLQDVPRLVEAGAAAFKFSTLHRDDDRFPRILPHLMYRACRMIAPTGLAVGIHNESDDMVHYGVAKARTRGRRGAELHGLSRPPIAENLAMHEVYEIGAATGCRAHVVHVTTGRGCEIADGYRRDGHHASVETCIHYLVLDEDDVRRLGAFGKINPPIRSRREVEALWRHLVRGNIDFVSTDHVAWSKSTKETQHILDASSGVPGLDLLLPLLIEACMARDVDLTWVSRLLAENPAKHFRIDDRKGSISPGRDADLAIVVADSSIYQPPVGPGWAGWSPYAGRRLPVRVSTTYRRGAPIFIEGKAQAEPGSGRFIKPQIAAGCARDRPFLD